MSYNEPELAYKLMYDEPQSSPIFHFPEEPCPFHPVNNPSSF
jgi:hypothetical protein